MMRRRTLHRMGKSTEDGLRPMPKTSSEAQRFETCFVERKDSSGRAIDVRTCDMSGAGDLMVAAGQARAAQAIYSSFSGEDDVGNPRVYSMNGGEIAQFQGHGSAPLMDCAMSGDGKYAASCDRDGRVMFWKASDGSLLRQLSTTTLRCGTNSVSTTFDGGRVACVSQDNTLKIWDTKTGSSLGTFAHSETAQGCSLDWDGKFAFSACSDNNVYAWDVRVKKRPAYALIGHSKPVRQCELELSGGRLVSCGADNEVRLWDLRMRRASHRFVLSNLSDLPAAPIRGCGIAGDGSRVVACGDSGRVQVWNAKTGDKVCSLSQDIGRVHDCAISGMGDRVVTVDASGGVRAFSLQDLKEEDM